MNVFKPTLKKVVMGLFENKMLTAACRAFFEIIQDRLLKDGHNQNRVTAHNYGYGYG